MYVTIVIAVEPLKWKFLYAGSPSLSNDFCLVKNLLSQIICSNLKRLYVVNSIRLHRCFHYTSLGQMESLGHNLILYTGMEK